MNISLADGVLVDNYIYFSNTKSNGLFGINIDTQQIEQLAFFPYERIEAGYLHKRCFAFGERLVFLPAHSRHISIYDLMTKEFKIIPFENDIQGEAISDAVKIGKNVYIFPRNEECTPYRLNLESFELSRVPGFEKFVDKYISHNNPDKFYRVACSGEGIYFGLNETSLIAKWNVNMNTFETFNTGMDRIINICPVGDSCFFTVREKYGIGKLDLKHGNVQFIECRNRNSIDANTYGCLFLFQDDVVAAPAYGEYIHYFNENECVFQYKTNDMNAEYKFYRYILVRDKIWLLPITQDIIYILDGDYKVNKIKLIANNDIQNIFRKEIVKEKLMERCVVEEGVDITLNDYLNYI